MSAESGNCRNEKVTTYSVKNKEGKIMTETVKQSKENGEVERFVDGEKVESPSPSSDSQQKMNYVSGNGEYIMIKLLESMQYELKSQREELKEQKAIIKELTYYCSYLEKPKSKTEEK